MGFQVRSAATDTDSTRLLTGVPIATFTATYARIKDLTMDETIVSHAVTRHASTVLVSEDGKRLRRRDPFSLLDSEDFARRTVYLEGLAPDMKLRDILERAIGPLERLLFPQILSSWNEKQGPGVTGTYPNLVISNQVKKRKIRNAGYCFAVFESAANAEKLAANEDIGMNGEDAKSLSHFRIIPFREHQALTAEYKKHLAAQHKLLREEMERRKHTFGGSRFVPGLVAEFSGVHPSTNRRVLKRLFQRIGEVAYVDFVAAVPGAAPGTRDGHGWVRFKHAHEARKAEAYFRGTKVVQATPDDATGVLQDSMPSLRETSGPPEGAEGQGRMTVFGYRGAERPRPPIRLRILKDKEEEDYWMKIAEQKDARVRKDRVVKEAAETARESQHQSQTDAGEALLPVKGNHVVFSDSDESDEEEDRRDQSEKRNRGSDNDEEGRASKRFRSIP